MTPSSFLFFLGHLHHDFAFYKKVSQIISGWPNLWLVKVIGLQKDRRVQNLSALNYQRCRFHLLSSTRPVGCLSSCSLSAPCHLNGLQLLIVKYWHLSWACSLNVLVRIIQKISTIQYMMIFKYLIWNVAGPGQPMMWMSSWGEALTGFMANDALSCWLVRLRRLSTQKDYYQ
jgi:hypothetical protein